MRKRGRERGKWKEWWENIVVGYLIISRKAEITGKGERQERENGGNQEEETKR